MLNILVPMAGAGSRFAKAGYTTPKPFIDVLGRPMIEHVLENLVVPEARFILTVRKEHLNDHDRVFNRLGENYNITIRTIDFLTEGPVATVFLSADLINGEDPLLIANSDQLVDIAIGDYIKDSDDRGLDGSILTFPATDPKWSYAATDEQGIVTEVKEKVPISPNATVGIYYFRKGSDFMNAAALMVGHNDRTNNEFYVGPAYNYMIRLGKKLGIYHIAEEQMHGLGTPADLDIFLQQATKQPA